MQLLVDIDGPLDAAVLRASAVALLDRHPNLRAAFWHLAADALGSAKTGTLGGLKIVGRRARRTREGEWGTPYVLLDRKAEANYQQYLETSKESA